MAEYVEARSLATLNNLASNPPQYPKKPTGERQDPLTLYISRVPGTRDIILSTLKPQVKNVTAEDVASSLYYVHLDVPEDEPLLPPDMSRESHTPRSSEESPVSQIHRKPLPNELESPSSGGGGDGWTAPAPTAEKENHSLGMPTRKPSRKPVPGQSSAMPSGQRSRAPSNPTPPTGPIQRKPLVPNLRTADVAGRDLPPVPPRHDQSPVSYHSPAGEDQPPPLPTRPKVLPPAAHPTDGFASHAPVPMDNSRSDSPTKQRPFVPFSLTLIRRDPSSGQQWNVGKVASFQLENPELISEEKHHQPSPSVSIHLETSGYAKFRGMPTDVDMKAILDPRPGSSSSGRKLQIPDTLMHMPASGAFEREVKMAYSPSFTANLKHRFRRRSSDDGRPASPFKRPQGHGRHGSSTSVGSFGGDFDGSEPPVITQPAPGLKPRGYTFYSPWDGRCEFLTGNGGRSLKCRHVLPNYGGGVFNPLVDGPEEGGSGGGGGVGFGEGKTQPISELRFNLPSSELFSAERRSGEGGVRARDQLQTHFNRVLSKAQGRSNDYNSDSDDYDDNYPLDLSLGKEKAGGGNRGKRAKMGKLIVFDEGLKMLDLAVAANVGVWWISWERTY
ncbi:Uu.00g075010.m01.CDS01 [Anthostomella pinea]|uniref:Uu.00g075010.m01.CDS01 n=1 Tax=Anthostomella pinea TaxID=933095 RepID=A0AAI8VPY2_9PEZI|nr:Uu.00g075010.m01.CDS01 [Anthostomella pinea]